MTNSSLEPNGNGDVMLPLMMLLSFTFVALSKPVLSSSDEVDMRISYPEAGMARIKRNEATVTKLYIYSGKLILQRPLV